MASFFKNLFRKENDPAVVAPGAGEMPNGKPLAGSSIFEPEVPEKGGPGNPAVSPAAVSSGVFPGATPGGSHLTARELAALLPPDLLRYDGVGPETPVPLPAGILKASLDAGRPAILISQIFEACPALFQRRPGPGEDSAVVLPPARVKRILESAGTDLTSTPPNYNPFDSMPAASAGAGAGPAAASNPFVVAGFATPASVDAEPVSGGFAASPSLGRSPFAPAPGPSGPPATGAASFAAAPAVPATSAAGGLAPIAPHPQAAEFGSPVSVKSQPAFPSAMGGSAPALPFASSPVDSPFAPAHAASGQEAIGAKPPGTASPASTFLPQPFGAGPFAAPPELESSLPATVPGTPARVSASETPYRNGSNGLSGMHGTNGTHATNAVPTAAPPAILKTPPVLSAQLPDLPRSETAPAGHLPPHPLTPPATAPGLATASGASAPAEPLALGGFAPGSPGLATGAPATFPASVQSSGSTPVPVQPLSPFNVPALASTGSGPDGNAKVAGAGSVTPSHAIQPPDSRPVPAAVVSNQHSGSMEISLRAALRDADPKDLGFAPANIPDSVRLTLPLALVTRQLATGRVEVTIDEIRAGIAPKFHPAFGRSASGLKVVVPMSEIFHNLPEAAKPSLTPGLASSGSTHISITTSPFQTPFSIQAAEDEAKSLPEAPPYRSSNGSTPLVTDPASTSGLPQYPPLLPVPPSLSPVIASTPPTVPAAPRSSILSRPPGSTGASPPAPPETPPSSAGSTGAPRQGMRFRQPPAASGGGGASPAKAFPKPPQPPPRPASPQPPVFPPMAAAIPEPEASDDLGESFSAATLGAEPPPRPGSTPVGLPTQASASKPTQPVLGPATSATQSASGNPFPLLAPLTPLLTDPVPVASLQPEAISGPSSSFFAEPSGAMDEEDSPPASGIFMEMPPSLISAHPGDSIAAVSPETTAFAESDDLSHLPLSLHTPAGSPDFPASEPREESGGTAPAAAPATGFLSGSPLNETPPSADAPASFASEDPQAREDRPESASTPAASGLSGILQDLLPVQPFSAMDRAAGSPVDEAPQKSADSADSADSAAEESALPSLETSSNHFADKDSPGSREAPAVLADSRPAPIIGEDLTYGCINDLSQLILRAVLGTNQPLSPQNVVDRCAGLPGLKACVLFRQDSTLVSHGMDPAEAANFQSSAVRTRDSLTTLAVTMGIGPTGNFTLRTDQGVRSFFLEPGLCLAVWHDQPSFAGGTREKLILIAQELARS